MSPKLRDITMSWIVLMSLTFVIYTVTRDVFLDFASNSPLIGGFVKFFFLASYGDFIANRIKNKSWTIPTGFFFKALVWGIIGVVIVMIFGIFTTGVHSLQANGILPFEGSAFASALFISILMNFTFAPTMMVAHRISDSYIEQRRKKLSLTQVIKRIDFAQFLKFTILRTIPFFWVPAHTITFMLPEEYRVIFAAILGIFLGLILGMFNAKKKDVAEVE
jgi:hypothetical protein